MFRVPIKDTDAVSVSLLPTVSNVAMFSHVICLKFKNIQYIQRQNRMITRKIKVKSIENEETIMAVTMTKTIITKIILIIMMRVRMKIGNRMEI